MYLVAPCTPRTVLNCVISVILCYVGTFRSFETRKTPRLACWFVIELMALRYLSWIPLVAGRCCRGQDVPASPVVCKLTCPVRGLINASAIGCLHCSLFTVHCSVEPLFWRIMEDSSRMRDPPSILMLPRTRGALTELGRRSSGMAPVMCTALCASVNSHTGTGIQYTVYSLDEFIISLCNLTCIHI